MELVNHRRDIHLEINESDNDIKINIDKFNAERRAYIKLFFEILFTFICFLIKINCISKLLNKYGTLLITNEYYTGYYPLIDDIELETKEAYTVFPLNIRTELEEMYLDGNTLEPLKDSLSDGVLDYLHVECNVKINYDKIDCDNNCKEILEDYEQKQDNEELSMCIYKNKINFFLDIFNYYGPCFVLEMYYLLKIKKDYFISREYLKISNLDDESKSEHENNVDTFKIINFLLPYMLAFLWNDLTNYVVSSKNSINLYNNYYDVDKYKELEIDYIATGLLQFVVGTMNIPIYIWIWIPGINFVLLVPKMIFSLTNISFVFVNIFNFNMFAKLFNLKYGFNSLQLNTPIFWYYWDCFFSIIIKIGVFQLFDKYFK